jgi:hypothetical protein
MNVRTQQHLIGSDRQVEFTLACEIMLDDWGQP